MSQPLVTILVPHYKTLELTKLCLRLLRKYTDPDKVKVIVIDNDSQDESLTYLRALTWIELIERQSVPKEGSITAHSRALDLGLERVTSPYVLSIHTDTLVKHPLWLEFLLAQIAQRPTIAGVGSWKLESKSRVQQSLKFIERCLQLSYYRLIGKDQHGVEGAGKNHYYLRSHCALYRMDLLRQHNLHFTDGDRLAGKYMHKSLIEAGYEMLFLRSEILINYLEHINHATTLLNPQLRKRQNSVDKGLRRIEKSLARLNADVVLADVSLDR